MYEIEDISQNDEMEMTSVHLEIKLLVVGDILVGKTSLLHRFGAMQCSEWNSDGLTGCEYFVKVLRIENRFVRVHFWSITALELLSTKVYDECDGVAIVVDLTRKGSLSRLDYWLSQIEKFSPGDVSRVLIGNKYDLALQRGFGSTLAAGSAGRNEMPYIETSAVTGHNVEYAFGFLISDTVKVMQMVDPFNKKLILRMSRRDASWRQRQATPESKKRIKRIRATCCCS